MKLKIISGGQTGADLAGLWVAKTLGLETGGTAPKSYETLIGQKPALAALFNLTESAGDYRVRTVENVRAADLTLVFSRNMRSPGTVLTINSCLRQGKPCFQVPDLRDRETETISEYWDRSPTFSTLWGQVYGLIYSRMLLHESCVINVAGNATKNSRDAFEFTFVGLWQLLEELVDSAHIGDLGIDRAKFELDPAALAARLKDRYEEVDRA